jgi:tellurite resistance protein TerC
VLTVPLWMWAVFAVIVIASLIVDLAYHGHGRATARRAAIAWSVIWISVALAFAAWVGLTLGRDQAEDFLTAYLMEKSLSLDNLFVFLLVFARLRMPSDEQHRVLFWGVLGALAFRAIFIAAGSAALSRWHEITYVLGAILVYTGWKTWRSHGGSASDKDSRIMRALRARGIASPFALALITIEITDIMFAVDSVPAVFAITSDPFIVYTSNVFAILGLRALYLVLADLLGRVHYLHHALAAILVLAGAKMLTSDAFHVPHLISLLAIAAILAGAIIASIRRNRADEASSPPRS